MLWGLSRGPAWRKVAFVLPPSCVVGMGTRLDMLLARRALVSFQGSWEVLRPPPNTTLGVDSSAPIGYTFWAGPGAQLEALGQQNPEPLKPFASWGGSPAPWCGCGPQEGCGGSNAALSNRAGVGAAGLPSSGHCPISWRPQFSEGEAGGNPLGSQGPDGR